MELLGLTEKNDKVLSTITIDILKSSEIEGLLLNHEQVRSSVARRLGIREENSVKSDRDIDAVVEMMIDATTDYEKEFSSQRLFGWHACLFPTGYSGMYKIDVGKYRTNPMQVVSGGIGQEKIHYVAPDADRLETEMQKFFEWIKTYSGDSLIKAAIAHLWFVTIHPFDDGNGRIARTIADMILCQSDRTSLRFYSMSNQIMKEKNKYYEVLEATQKGGMNITEWIEWFLNCLRSAIKESCNQTNEVIRKYEYLQSIENVEFNQRQRLMIQKLVSGSWFGVLNSSKWAKIAKCSSDTALRDINDLIEKGILEREPTAGGRSTNYVLKGYW